MVSRDLTSAHPNGTFVIAYSPFSLLLLNADMPNLQDPRAAAHPPL